MTTAHCAAFLFLMLLSAASTSGPSYKTYNANLKGSLLVLDVSSVINNGPHSPAGVGTAGRCQEYCSRLLGCTGYTFCSLVDGCGNGCPAYVQSHGAPLYLWPENPTLYPPYPYLGPYGPSSACYGDKWPANICSLKVATSVSKPEFYSTDPAEGWVSGVVVQPKECAGVSGVACDRCRASKDPKACIACARKVVSPASKRAAVVYGNEATLAEGCAACVALPAAPRKTCVACIAAGKPCAQCAVDKAANQRAGFGPLDLPACLSCSTAYPRTYSECQSCASAPAAARAKCLSCIQTLYPKMCTWPSRYNAAATPGCVGDGYFDPSFCYGCAVRAGPKLADKCIKCAARNPFNKDCTQCNSFATAAQRAKCFECAVGADLGRDVELTRQYASGGACYECLMGYTGPVDSCFKCLVDSTVPQGSKYYCASCNGKTTAAAKGTCFKCLKGKQPDMCVA